MALPLSNDEVRERLRGRKLDLIGPWVGQEAEYRFRCLANPRHGTFKATGKSVMANLSGCKKCRRNFKLTTRQVNARLGKRQLRLKEGQVWHGSVGTTYTVVCEAGLKHPDFEASGGFVLRWDSDCPECVALRKRQRKAKARPARKRGSSGQFPTDSHAKKRRQPSMPKIDW